VWRTEELSRPVRRVLGVNTCHQHSRGLYTAPQGFT
jgi:hypothetical protein